jgi:nucleoid DNA-binding protein|tara:strand:+ start:492 stop:719 length:228 start_codon:yes stop_codon:yes gene_type:complete
MKNSKDIVDKINDTLPFSKETIRSVVNKTFSELKERISKGDKVMLRGFVKFVSSSNKKSKTYSIEQIKQLKTKNK